MLAVALPAAAEPPVGEPVEEGPPVGVTLTEVDQSAVEYRKQRKDLNERGIYLVSTAVECGRFNLAYVKSPACPPTGKELEMGWWLTRERFKKIAEHVVERENKVKELEARVAVGDAQPLVVSNPFSNLKWFSIGIGVGILFAGSVAVAIAVGASQR